MLRGPAFAAQFVCLTCAVVLSACTEEENFEQIGYFKDDLSNRVFVIKAKSDVDTKVVKKAVEGLAQTSGRTTIAFVYEASSAEVSDWVTLAPDFAAANSAVLQNQASFRWWFRRSPSGETALIDCTVSPGESVCERS